MATRTKEWLSRTNATGPNKVQRSWVTASVTFLLLLPRDHKQPRKAFPLATVPQGQSPLWGGGGRSTGSREGVEGGKVEEEKKRNRKWNESIKPQSPPLPGEAPPPEGSKASQTAPPPGDWGSTRACGAHFHPNHRGSSVRGLRISMGRCRPQEGRGRTPVLS